MDNFLHNLRNGNNKRDRYRRPYGNNQNGGHDRYGNNQRGESHRQNVTSSEQSMNLLFEATQIIKDFLESSMENQKRTAEIAERRIKAEEKRVEAMQNIAGILENMTSVNPGTRKNSTVDSASVQEKETDFGSVVELTQNFVNSQPAAAEANEKRSPYRQERPSVNTTRELQSTLKKATLEERTGIIQTIRDFRSNSVSFKDIAQYFETNDIPTFSGKGRWYASTVANILKSEKKKAAQTEEI